MTVEELEPWILMSADAAPGLDLFAAQSTTDYAVHELLAERDEVEDGAVFDSETDLLVELELTETPLDSDGAPWAEADQPLRRELVILDSGVQNAGQLYELLAAQQDATRALDVVVLDAERDGVQQIAEILGHYRDLDAVHVLSHGTAGALRLGSTWLAADNVDDYAGKLQEWRAAFGAEGDLLLYGCDLAATDGGRSLVAALGAWTGTDVAASDDVTGAEVLGGDWVLEYSAGKIETAAAPDAASQASFTGALAAPTTTPVTLAPIAEDSGPRLITQAELLVNANDVDGDPLTASALAISAGGGMLVDNGDGTWTYTPAANDNSSVSFSYTIGDGNGGSVAGTASLDILAVADGLWLSARTSATSSAGSGGVTYNDGQVVRFTDPNLALGAGTTAGTFSQVFDIDVFAGADTDVNGLHYVSRSVTVGTVNPVTLQAGDVLLSVDSNVTLGGVAVTSENIVLFRPTTVGDYSAGTFSVLLRNPGGTGNNIRDFALVEQAMTVGGTALQAGDFLLVLSSPGYHRDVNLFRPTTMGTNPTGGTLNVLIDGQSAGIGFGQQIYGLELVQQATTIGGTLLNAGQILVSVNGNDVVGTNNLSVTDYDVFALTVTATGAGTSSATASLIMRGGDVGLSGFGEEIDALALVGGGNTAPTTTPVTLAPIAEDSGPRLITQAELLANASDIDSDPLTASALAISAGSGTLVDNGNGTWTYTPAANDSSSVSFSYTISDGNGGSVAGAASLDITPVNDAPTTAPVTLAPIAEDSGPRVITQAQLLVNANDVDGDPLTASGLAISAGTGTLVDNGNGTWTYTPPANDSSGVSFVYTISDGNGGSVAGSASLDITPVNDAPTTAPVTLAPIAEDSGPRLITQAELLANASDLDGDALTANGLAISAGSGTLVDNGNGTWTYTPAANDSSSVSFSYTISDGNGGSVAGAATLDITPVNDAPTTAPVALAPIAEDSGPRLITQAQLLANAADVDGDALVASGLAINAGSGTLVDNGNGTWTYTPAVNDSSSVSFSYTISDGNGGSVAGSASLDITPVDDAPTTAPVTLAAIAEDSGPRLITQAQLLANAADVDGDALVASGLAINAGGGTLVDNGNGTWTYTPAANDSSSVSFSYTISDGNGGSVAGAASLDITPVNDAPTTAPVTLAPIAEDSGPRLITQAELLVNANDVDGDPLTASGLAISAGSGTLVDNGNGTWTYTPAANDSSSVSFSYTISDGNGGSVAGAASLDITPANDAPTTAPVTLAPIAENSGPRLVTQAELLANAADVDGDPLTASGLTISAGSGTLVDNGNGTWTYTPAANDSSSVTFGYTISDGNGGSVAGSASLDITPASNNPPTTTPVTLAAIDEDSGPRLITQAQLLVNANDVDGDPLTASNLAISAGSGTLIDNGNGTWTYTPAADDSSSVSFSYTISDGNGGSVAGAASLDLMPVNDAPLVTSNGGGPSAAIGIAENTNAVTVVTSTDVEGDTVQYSIAGGADAAQFRIDSATGALTFAPAPNYEAPADSDGDNVYEVIVRADDGQGGAASQTLQIAVTGVNEVPTGGADALETADGQPLIIVTTQLLANDVDVDGDTLQLASFSSPLYGTLTQDTSGNWLYTPQPGFVGTDVFTYTLVDASGRSATAQVTLIVSGPSTYPVLDAAASELLPNEPPAPQPAQADERDSDAPSVGPGGGGPLQGSDDDFGDDTLVDESPEPPTDGETSALERFVAEIERQRVLDVRLWTPLGELELMLPSDQVVANMADMLMALAQSAPTEEVARSLAVFDETFADLADSARRADRQVGQVVMGSGVALSAGIVAWLLRGGALAASLFSTLPAWVAFDPVPILVGNQTRPPAGPKPNDDSRDAAVARVLRSEIRHAPSGRG